MKRDPRLRPLSRDHHHALVLARRASLAAVDGSPNALRQAWDLVLQRLPSELLPHFAIEERFLLPALSRAGEQALVDRALDDHRALRDLVEKEALDPRAHLAAIGARLAEIGARLTEHVRFEERVLFPVAEAKLTDQELEEIVTAGPVPLSRKTPREGRR